MKKYAKILLVCAFSMAIVGTATAAAIAFANSNSGPEEKLRMNEDKTAAAISKDGLYAIMNTSKGAIVLELYYQKAPLTVSNFVGLAEGTLDAAKGKKFYNGLTFHRVIADFMIQGGDPLGTGTGGPGYKFADEFDSSLKFDGPGVLAMANSGANTNGSQFFITHVATPWLDNKHTIFGRVIEGQDVVNAVAQGDKIVSLKIERKGDAAKKFTATQEDFNRYASERVARAKAQAENAKKDSIATIEAKWPTAKKSSSGVYYVVTKEGTGAGVKTGQALTMKYKGYLLNGTVFDDSDMREPLTFAVGRGQLIPGFDSQALEMKVGEKRTIVIPPELAYGATGAGGVIPPNAYIAFDLELLSAK